MTSIKNIEQRVIELESKVSFQEDLIDDLNEVVVIQQKQLDKVEEGLKAAHEQFKKILSGSGDIDGI